MFLMVRKALFSASAIAVVGGEKRKKNCTVLGCKKSCKLSGYQIFFKARFLECEEINVEWLLDISAFTTLAAKARLFFSYKGKCPKIVLGCCL